MMVNATSSTSKLPCWQRAAGGLWLRIYTSLHSQAVYCKAQPNSASDLPSTSAILATLFQSACLVLLESPTSALQPLDIKQLLQKLRKKYCPKGRVHPQYCTPFVFTDVVGKPGCWRTTCILWISRCSISETATPAYILQGGPNLAFFCIAQTGRGRQIKNRCR